MNKKYYKETFSAFQPSDAAVERVFEMTTDKRKTKMNTALKRVGTALLAFVILACGGMGVHTIVKDSADNRLGVMIACAGEKKLLKAERINEQKLFYRIYIADLENESEMQNVKNEWGNEKAEQLELAKNLKEGISGCVKSSSSSCYSSERDKETAAIYTLSAGLFSLNLDDYTYVESLTVENSGKYGELNLEIAVESDELIATKTGHRISIKSDDLKYSVQSGMFCWGTGKGEVNKGYDLYWDISEELKKAIGNDIAFDLSTIEDTIIFTVKYLDGSTEQAKIDLGFNKDGYMYIINAD